MHTVSAQMKAKVDARVLECVNIAKQWCAKNFIDAHDRIKVPTLRYDINSARLGGYAIGGHTVRLNPVFLNAHTDEYIKDTVGHEMAHIFVRQIYGNGPKSHGYEWKRMMSTLGLVASRCHDMEVPEGVKVGKPKMKYNYTCSVCRDNIVVGPKHHAGLQKGRSLFHAQCGRGSKLVYVGDIGRLNYGEAKVAAQTGKYPAPTIKVPKVPTATDKQPKTGTKMWECKQLMARHSNYSRKQMIDMFITRVGCTKAGASTYYATLNKS